MTEPNPRSRRRGRLPEDTDRQTAQFADSSAHRHKSSGLILLLAGLAAGVLLGYGIKTMADRSAASHRKPQPVLTEEEKMDGIRTSLEQGTSVMTTLRKYFREYIVMYHKDGYKFIPIDQSMKLHDYSSENVRKLEDGEWQYMKNNKVISHKGIDVSSHQGEIDWAQVAGSNVEFAIIRALYRGYESGKLVEDTKFRANIEGAQANGIDTGVYVFTQAVNKEEVEEEVALLEELLGSYDFKGPVVVDVEETADGTGRMDLLSVEERTELVLHYCELIKKAGYKPMLYYNIEAAMFMLDLKQLEGIDKWFATYTSEFYFPYAYTYWQYSDKGSIPGITGNVDMDIRFGK